jgi:outer membrane protein assembly factor BamB
MTQDPRDGSLQIVYPDGYIQKLGRPGPVEASYVCLHTRDGLTALDPLRGTVLWSKTDVPMRAQVFGDDQHIYWVETRADHTVSTGHAVRAQDGVSVEVPDFSRLYQRRRGLLGRHLMIGERRSDDLTLRCYDVQTGKDVWKKSFSPGSLALQSAEPELAGVVEAKNGGRVTVVDLQTFQEVLAARMDARDLEKAGTQVHLLRDADHIYLAVQKPFDPQVNPWGGASTNLGGGLRWVPVNGKLYAYDRVTGKLCWKNDVPNQTLILEQFKDLPVMLFTARHHRQVNLGGMNRTIQQIASTRSIDKRTGKLLFDKEFQNNYTQQFYALTANRQTGTIDLISYSMKLHHYLDPDSLKKSDASTTP